MLLYTFALILLLVIFLRDSFVYNITPNPTSRHVKKIIAQLIPNQNIGTVFELGSGFGGMSVYLNQILPKSAIYSYEKAKIPFLIQKLRLTLFSRKRIKLKYQNFFEESWTNADLVFCYLYRGAMSKVAQKFKHELKPGSALISHTFALGQIQADKILFAKDLYHTPVYLYIKKG